MVKKKDNAKKTVAKTVPTLDKETKYSLNHANLYYIMMVISLVLGIFFLVQGIIFQVGEYQIEWEITFYTMFVLLMVVAKSSYNRGRGHYHYHGHLKYR